MWFLGKSAGEAVPPAALRERVSDFNQLEDLCGGLTRMRAIWMYDPFSSCSRYLQHSESGLEFATADSRASTGLM